MAKCDVCGKGVHFGNNVSHSHRRSNAIWKSNVKSVKCMVNGASKKLHVCTSCLKSGAVERAQFHLLKKPVHSEQAFSFYYESHIKHIYPTIKRKIINTIAPTLLDMKSINNIPTAIKNAINPMRCFKESFMPASLRLFA